MASIGALNAASNLEVTNASLVSITVLPADPTILLGQSQQFTVQGTFSDGTTQEIGDLVAWRSSVPSAAVISNSGLATSAGTGETSIMATRQGTAANSTLTVQ
jgi:hypothetical protein